MNDMDPHWCECNKPQEVKFKGTVIGIPSEGFSGGYWWNVKVDKWISGSLPCNTVHAYYMFYADAILGHYDRVQKGDEVEVYGSVDPNEKCYINLNGESYYIKKIEKPDLIIQDIYWSPSNPKQGDTVTINVKTKNQGSENAGGFYVCYYVDGSYYDRDYVSSLSAGSTTTTSFSWTADCGSHAIKAVADCYDAVTESDEENNWRSKGGLNIPCNPDLIIQDISWSPSSPKMGETVTINIITKNKGSGNTGGFDVCY